MKIPRDVSGDELGNLLMNLGYNKTKQTGSHIRFTTSIGGGRSITIPRHKGIKIGTLNNILNDVSKHLNISKQELIHRLRGG